MAGPPPLSKMTRPIRFAPSSCGSGGKPRNASILPSINRIYSAFLRRIGDPAKVLLGIEPDLGGHQGQQEIRARPEPRDANSLSFQTGNAVNVFMAEQYEAADMHAGQQRARLSLIEGDDEVRGIVHHQIHLTARQLLGGHVGRAPSTKRISVKPSASSSC